MTNRSRTVFSLAALALVGSIALSGCIPVGEAAPTTAARNADGVYARTITVVGSGEVNAKPDIAKTTVGVEVQAQTVDVAMTEAQKRMTAVIDALKELGIANKDIQTSNFSISFERTSNASLTRSDSDKPAEFEAPAGFYRVSNMVQVIIRDLDQVATVLDESVKAGANNVWGISFELSDTDPLMELAREDAVENARARAQSLADLSGVDLGEVMSISENIGNSYLVDTAARGMGGGGTPVEPGELTFTMQIQVVFAIE